MKKAKIYYARMDEFWRKEEKYNQLEKLGIISNVDWQEIKPNKNYIWLTNGLEDEFSEFISIGNKESRSQKGEVKDCIFKIFSNGLHSSRDSWVYNFNKQELLNNIEKTIKFYNSQVSLWCQNKLKSDNIDGFVNYDDTQISWSRDLKKDLKSETFIKFSEENVRKSLYRPFAVPFLYFADGLNDSPNKFRFIFPIPNTEIENRVICLSDAGLRSPFSVLCSIFIPDLHLCATSDAFQCFPFYLYDKDGTNRQENITNWALETFQSQYQDQSITKWDIFHYTYTVLHHPHYRQRYAANLKRELPRIPFAPEFWPFAQAGKRLAEIHVNYEQQPEYRLKHLENKDLPIDWRVEKMLLSKDKTQIKYNEFLTLTGILSKSLNIVWETALP